MQSDDARYLKRKIRTRTIDVHPTEKALIVTYELEALILGDLGDPLLGNRKECQKIIRLKSLNEHTNCAALAKEVVDKCSLIHPNKYDEVKHLISYLQKRKAAGTGAVTERGDSPRPSSSCSSSDGPYSNSTSTEKLNINNIEQYVELLYEDIPEKINGSALILQLARVPDNLVELANNESVLSALSRVLREDWKKSIDLSINIIYTFFCFSAYSQFHHVVLQYKVGSLCMEVLDYELRRYDQWKDEMDTRRRKCDGSNGSVHIHNSISDSIGQMVDGSKSPEIATIESRSRRVLEGGVSHIPIAAGDNRRSWEMRRRHMEGNKGGVVDPKEELRQLAEDYERMKHKLSNLIKKQDQLLRVIFYLLLNMAENSKVEDKMRKKNICGMLAKTLDRDNANLLHLVVTFLRKLSVFRENVDDMADMNVVEKLPKVLMMNNPEVIEVTLQLLLNLSFDGHLRDRMVRVGFIPKVVSLLAEQKYESTVLKILYHLSMDDRCKSMFTYTDCIPMVMNMLMQSSEEESNMELIALCINLAINKRNAQMMVENNRLQCLMARAFRNQDSLIMKMIRNIAQHEGTKQNFVEFVGDISQAIVECDSEDFVVECVGVLGNLTLPDLDFSQLMQRFNLIPWVTNILVPGKHEDDLVLEVVVLLGTAAADEGCATLLCKADILLSLIELLKGKGRYITNSEADLISNSNAWSVIHSGAKTVLSEVLSTHMYEATSSHGRPVCSCKSDSKLSFKKRKKSRHKFYSMLQIDPLMGPEEGNPPHSCSLMFPPCHMSLAKQEDDEMVLQIIFVFYQISRHVATRDYLIKETEAPAYLIDLMHDKNTQIRRVCNACLEIIAECNKEWEERIKLEKFRWHNSQWLEMVESSSLDEPPYATAGDMDDLPSFYTDDMIQRTMLYPSGSDFDLDHDDDVVTAEDNKLCNETLSRPRSRHNHEMDGEFAEPMFHSKSGLSSSNSSEDLVRNGLKNLVLGPLLASSDMELEKLDEPQYVMI